MKQTLLIIVNLLGFKRKKPTTKLKHGLRWCEHALNIIAIFYLLLLAFPQPLFSHSIENAGLTLYSTDPIPDNAGSLLSAVRTKLRKSTLHQEEDSFRVFLCNNPKLFTLLAPIHRRSFGLYYPLLNNIVIASGDINQDRCRAYRHKYNERSLSGVITHEAGHSLMGKHLGFWADLRLPKWLKEGYCEVLAEDSSFPAERGDYLITSGKSISSGSFHYYTYRKMVDCLLNEKSLSIEQLVSNPPNKNSVLKETQDWLNKTSNQRVDPTWTTPVESGQVQGTQGHP